MKGEEKRKRYGDLSHTTPRRRSNVERMRGWPAVWQSFPERYKKHTPTHLRRGAVTNTSNGCPNIQLSDPTRVTRVP